MKQESLQFEGTVKQELGNSMFRVALDNVNNDSLILCTISGKIRKNYIKIMAGDRVKIEMSPYDLTKGRIFQRITASNRPVLSSSNSNNKNNKKKK
jgi:translation initiation factor IF-1